MTTRKTPVRTAVRTQGKPPTATTKHPTTAVPKKAREASRHVCCNDDYGRRREGLCPPGRNTDGRSPISLVQLFCVPKCVPSSPDSKSTTGSPPRRTSLRLSRRADVRRTVRSDDATRRVVLKGANHGE